MSDAFLSLNGGRAVTGRVTVPYYGAWTGEIVLASSAAFTPAVTISVGDLTMSGTVRRSADFAGSRSALIVGGKSGWRSVIPARGYSLASGVLLSAVLADAAREAGETIVVASDRSIGTSYARRADVAERVLRRFLGGQWWIDPAGVTQTGPRSSAPITSPFTVEHWSGSKGRFAVATENYADWLPGRTFTSPTVTGVNAISSVSYTADDDGKVRLDVLTTTTAEDRLHEQLRSLIRDEVASLTFASTFGYQVAASSGRGPAATVDVTPDDPAMPSILRVPLAPDLGVVAAPAAGTRCRIRFANGDPTRAECVALGSTTEHTMTAEACALLIYNTLGALMTAAGGGPLLAATLQPLISAAIVAALTAQGAAAPAGQAAQVTAAAAQLANFATGAPATTSSPFNAAIGALASKTLNVSGLFPSVGIPSNG